jgi:hypothetical protein
LNHVQASNASVAFYFVTFFFLATTVLTTVLTTVVLELYSRCVHVGVSSPCCSVVTLLID